MNVLAPVISWVRSGDNGAAVAGAGLVSGGCAAAVKMCAVAVIPAATVGCRGACEERAVRKRPAAAVVAIAVARTKGVDRSRPMLTASRASGPAVFTGAPSAVRQPVGGAAAAAQSNDATRGRASSRSLAGPKRAPSRSGRKSPAAGSCRCGQNTQPRKPASLHGLWWRRLSSDDGWADWMPS